jgi:hypothetical protein
VRQLAPGGSRLAIVVAATVFLIGTATVIRAKPAARPPAIAPISESAALSSSSSAVPAALIDDALDLRSGPVSVPLELQLPSLDVTAAVTGVGITPTDVMDAPMGPADDPVWQQAFWYRGSAVPGALSTALLAGHVDDPLGRPAVFAQIDRLQPGDLIVVRDTRNGLEVRFAVTGSATYSLEETADPVVLAEIYGVGPVAGTRPQPSVDGLSHLTLITCAGTFTNGTHDHRLVVYATRIT